MLQACVFDVNFRLFLFMTENAYILTCMDLMKGKMVMINPAVSKLQLLVENIFSHLHYANVDTRHVIIDSDRDTGINPRLSCVTCNYHIYLSPLFLNSLRGPLPIL
jgi:hypothetical protein